MVTLTEPLWLLLIIIPIVIWRRKHALESGNLVFSPAKLWPWIMHKTANRSSNGHHQFLVALILIIIALSGPLFITKPLDLKTEILHPEKTSNTAVVFLIDVSTSMKLKENEDSRLNIAKRQIEILLPHLKNNDIALLLFSDQAYTLLPLSRNFEYFRQFLSTLNINEFSNQGSNISAGLSQARQLLTNSAAQARHILLLTDGDTAQRNAALYAAEKISQDKITLSIIGTGSRIEQPVHDFKNNILLINGTIITSKLEFDFLRLLAYKGNGHFFAINENTTNDIIKNLKMSSTAHKQERLNKQYPLYLWPLGLGVLLLLWVNQQRWRQGLILSTPLFLTISLLMALSPQNSHAGLWTQQRAYDALLKKQHHSAIYYYAKGSSYNDRLGLGTAYYRVQQWQPAHSAFQQAARLANNLNDRVQALYNSANSLLQLQEYNRAITLYEVVLTLQPHHKHSAYNLNLLRKKIRMAAEIQSSIKISPQAKHSVHNKNSQFLKNETAGEEKTISSAASNSSRFEKNTIFKNSLYSEKENTIAIKKIYQHRINKQTIKNNNVQATQAW